MTSVRKLSIGCALAAALTVLAGCGSRLQPAGGKILVDGNPVKEGTVMFYPVKQGRPATARILEDGSFTLSFERPGDGLPPGEYRVVIVADIWKEGQKTAAQAYDEANLKRQGIQDTSTNAGGILIHVVPPEYNDIATTPLTQKVESSREPQQFVYDIQSKKKK
ncbi:MAG TPA: hypothetical protein VL371_03050 [Gemmataceae bacterium]|jgi:hypothetical protein|nr:hypothetical protein [Gemmataceae bacterium]